MRLNAACMACLIRRQEENLSRRTQDEEVKASYMRQVLRIIADAPPPEPAPVVTARLGQLHEQYFGSPYSFDDLKAAYNQQMMEQLPRLRALVDNSPSPLRAALCLARAGNYIDFGAMGSIDAEKLRSLLDNAVGETLDEATAAAFLRGLPGCRRLTYLTDNCGEIVLDRLLIEILMREFPALQITVLVRGQPVLNDATLSDAQEIGLCDIVRVMGNSTAIAGTYLPAMEDAPRRAVEEADLIISKGQGNFETMFGTGLNIFYLFLCKCDLFVTRFGAEREGDAQGVPAGKAALGLKRFDGVFIHERDTRLSKI